MREPDNRSRSLPLSERAELFGGKSCLADKLTEQPSANFAVVWDRQVPAVTFAVVQHMTSALMAEGEPCPLEDACGLAAR